MSSAPVDTHREQTNILIFDCDHGSAPLLRKQHIFLCMFLGVVRTNRDHQSLTVPGRAAVLTTVCSQQKEHPNLLHLQEAAITASIQSCTCRSGLSLRAPAREVTKWLSHRSFQAAHHSLGCDKTVTEDHPLQNAEMGVVTSHQTTTGERAKNQMPRAPESVLFTLQLLHWYSFSITSPFHTVPHKIVSTSH